MALAQLEAERHAANLDLLDFRRRHTPLAGREPTKYPAQPIATSLQAPTAGRSDALADNWIRLPQQARGPTCGDLTK